MELRTNLETSNRYNNPVNSGQTQGVQSNLPTTTGETQEHNQVLLSEREVTLLKDLRKERDEARFQALRRHFESQDCPVEMLLSTQYSIGDRCLLLVTNKKLFNKITEEKSDVQGWYACQLNALKSEAEESTHVYKIRLYNTVIKAVNRGLQSMSASDVSIPGISNAPVLSDMLLLIDQTYIISERGKNKESQPAEFNVDVVQEVSATPHYPSVTTISLEVAQQGIQLIDKMFTCSLVTWDGYSGQDVINDVQNLSNYIKWFLKSVPAEMSEKALSLIELVSGSFTTRIDDIQRSVIIYYWSLRISRGICFENGLYLVGQGFTFQRLCEDAVMRAPNSCVSDKERLSSLPYLWIHILNIKNDNLSKEDEGRKLLYALASINEEITRMQPGAIVALLRSLPVFGPEMPKDGSFINEFINLLHRLGLSI